MSSTVSPGRFGPTLLENGYYNIRLDRPQFQLYCIGGDSRVRRGSDEDMQLFRSLSGHE